MKIALTSTHERKLCRHAMISSIKHDCIGMLTEPLLCEIDYLHLLTWAFYQIRSEKKETNRLHNANSTAFYGSTQHFATQNMTQRRANSIFDNARHRYDGMPKNKSDQFWVKRPKRSALSPSRFSTAAQKKRAEARGVSRRRAATRCSVAHLGIAEIMDTISPAQTHCDL